MHDSGPMWFATPSSCGSFIHNTLPVLTGALVAQFQDPRAAGCPGAQAPGYQDEAGWKPAPHRSPKGFVWVAGGFSLRLGSAVSSSQFISPTHYPIVKRSVRGRMSFGLSSGR